MSNGIYHSNANSTYPPNAYKENAYLICISNILHFSFSHSRFFLSGILLSKNTASWIMTISPKEQGINILSFYHHQHLSSLSIQLIGSVHGWYIKSPSWDNMSCQLVKDLPISRLFCNSNSYGLQSKRMEKKQKTRYSVIRWVSY